MRAKHVVTTLMTALAFVAAGSMAQAFDDMPGQVSLDSMVKLFEGVEFDHDMHADLGEDCSVCHHHTTGTGTVEDRCVRCHADSGEAATVGCRDCHVANPFSAEQINKESLDVYQFHTDQPGLKAAYHWNCIGCHQEMDGPTDCQDCHARTEEGDAFYHMDATGSGTAESGH